MTPKKTIPLGVYLLIPATLVAISLVIAFIFRWSTIETIQDVELRVELCEFIDKQAGLAPNETKLYSKKLGAESFGIYAYGVSDRTEQDKILKAASDWFAGDGQDVANLRIQFWGIEDGKKPKLLRTETLYQKATITQPRPIGPADPLPGI